MHRYERLEELNFPKIEFREYNENVSPIALLASYLSHKENPRFLNIKPTM